MTSPTAPLHLHSAHPHSVFVYGTLMPGERWESVAQQGGEFSSQAATLLGVALADLRPEGYPALFALSELSPHEQAQFTQPVRGYLYTYTPQSWPVALPFLDELEGLDLTPPLYRREQVTVSTSSGPQAAWVYLYNRPQRRAASGFEWVYSGSWQEVADRWQEGERLAWQAENR